jgi:hypothetical protein
MLAQSFGTIGPVVSEEIESKKAAEEKKKNSSKNKYIPP